MSRSRSPRPAHLQLVPPAPAASPWPPLPFMVPLLRPDQVTTPTEDALFTMLAQRAQRGDSAASHLLWRAFADRLEPVIHGCARVTWQQTWPRRDGRPWGMEDVRQEAFVVFCDLTASWDGAGAYVPYITAHFAWRLRTAVRRLGPQRQMALRTLPEATPAASHELLDVERQALLAAMSARLSPVDATVLDLHVREGLSLGEIAERLGEHRRTVTRRWQRVRAVAYEVLCPPDLAP